MFRNSSLDRFQGGYKPSDLFSLKLECLKSCDSVVLFLAVFSQGPLPLPLLWCNMIWSLLCLPGFICEMKLNNSLSRTNQIHTCLCGVYRIMKLSKKEISNNSVHEHLRHRCQAQHEVDLPILFFGDTLGIYFGRSQRCFGYAPEVEDQWLKVSIWLFFF